MSQVATHYGFDAKRKTHLHLTSAAAVLSSESDGLLEDQSAEKSWGWPGFNEMIKLIRPFD